jgi:hypothetical protein
MTLHLNEAERAAYNREKQRQHNMAYRERQAEKAWLREQRYQAIEQRSAETHEENERIKSAYYRLKQQFDELKAAPPRERIVTETVVEKVPVVAHVARIADVMAFVIEADSVLRENLWSELESYMRPFVK